MPRPQAATGAAPTGSATPSRRALVAGASGLIGRALLAQMSGERRPVLALLRRDLPEVSALPGVSSLRWHFDRRDGELPPVDDVFIALGSTIKAAGSQEAFRAVDFGAVLSVARAARKAGATRLAVVSALGANARSRVFYNRVKGEMEAAIAGLGYTSVVIARPSLLAGNREALGQQARAGERLAIALTGPVLRWLPASIRPIGAATVAAAMRRAVDEGRPGVTVLDSAALQRLGR